MTQHGKPADHSHVIPTTYEIERGNGHQHIAVACRECCSQDVQIIAVQARTGGKHDPRTLRIDLNSGEAVTEHTPAPGRTARSSSRTRIALTFGCKPCGHTWAAVFTQHAGATRLYRSQPTVT